MRKVAVSQAGSDRTPVDGVLELHRTLQPPETSTWYSESEVEVPQSLSDISHVPMTTLVHAQESLDPLERRLPEKAAGHKRRSGLAYSVLPNPNKPSVLKKEVRVISNVKSYLIGLAQGVGQLTRLRDRDGRRRCILSMGASTGRNG